MPGCDRPYFEVRINETRLGAVRMFTTNTVQDCLNYCVSAADCVGVDVNYDTSPIECWPHTNIDDYVESNLFTQPGTDSYQLITRCATTAATGSLVLSFAQSITAEVRP